MEDPLPHTVDEFDVDALLDAAQSSDEDFDDGELLSRSIEDILNDADDDDDTDDHVEAEHLASASVVRAEEALDSVQQNYSSEKQEQGSKLKISSRSWETGTTSAVPRPSPRPGAAVAAAAAASRQIPLSPAPALSATTITAAIPEVGGTSEGSSDGEVDGDGDEAEATIDTLGFSIAPPKGQDSEAYSGDEPAFVVAEEDRIVADSREQEYEIIRELDAPTRRTTTAVLDSVEEYDLQDFEDFEDLQEENLVASTVEETIDVTEESLGTQADTQLEDAEAAFTSSTVPDKPAKTPLEEAEELESGAANSGLYLEEGAAAQPMQLEGIQRGPPAIGLVQLDWKGPLSFALSSAPVIHDHGTPRALAIHASFIAVGMSKGTVILTPSKYSATRSADDNENKNILLYPPDKSHPSVTVLSFSFLGDLLLAGYSNGTVTLWDVPKAAVAKVVTTEHGVVVHAAFTGYDSSTGRQLKAITADSKGMVLLHTFALVPVLRLFSVSTRCIVNGQRTGVILSLSPWLPDESALSTLQANGPSSGSVHSGNDVGRKFLYDGSSTDDNAGLVVFVTQQALLVFCLTKLGLRAKLPRPDGVREGSMPYTSWRRVSVKTENSKAGTEDSTKDPIIALAWGKKAFVLHLRKDELQTVAQWDLDSKASGVAWLGEEMLAVLTAKAELFVYTKDGVEVERAALRDEQGDGEDLVCNTHFLDTSNNPEKVYANSLGVRGAAIYLLASSRLWRARLLPWQERIKVLQDAGDWMGAFQIAMEVYDGKARGVTGLPSGLRSLQQAIAPNLLSLLFAYIDEAFAYVLLALGTTSQTGMSSEDTQNAREHYARVGGVAIEFCLHIRRTDVLFENVFKKFEAVGQAATFLELLEPYILKDMLNGLAPEIMQSLVEHYSSKGWLQRVEQCILHMDIGSLDFSQVMKLCREHGLFSALIYLFNKGLRDFQSPVEELLAVAQSPRQDARYFGYKLLVYLKYCFSGLAFPPGRGHLPPEQMPEVKAELLRYILSPEGCTENMAFSRLYCLLKLDAAAALDVLDLAFTDQSIKQTFIQMMIDALVHIVETVAEQMVSVYEFLARYVSRRDACIPPTTLRRILEHLCSGSEKENLALAMLKAVPEDNWDPDDVLQLAGKASYWQVVALTHTRKEDYSAALDSHLKDSSRWRETFRYVRSMLSSESGLEPRVFADFRATVTTYIPQLVQQSRDAALFLILEYFTDQVKDIMKSLEAFPSSLFHLLKAVMDVHSYRAESGSDDIGAGGSEPWNDRVQLASMLERSHFDITDELVEFYVELMCQFEPRSVLPFLQHYDSYRLEQCLKLCQKYRVKDGAAYLLEMVGDVGSALALILEDLTGLFHELDKVVAANWPPSSKSPLDEIFEVKAVHSVKNAAISLCQRNTFRLDSQEAETLWFHLLDRYVHPLKSLVHLSTSKTQSSSQYNWQVLSHDATLLVLRRMFSKFVGDIVTGMVGYVPMHEILNKIISDHGNHEFGDFKTTILEMLTFYGYELAILGTAKNIIEADMFHNVVALRRGRSRALAPKASTCCICSSKSGGARHIFSCGHFAHLDCLTAGDSGRRQPLECSACSSQDRGTSPVTSNYSLSQKEQAREQHTPHLPDQKPFQIEEAVSGVSRFELLKSLQGQGFPDMLDIGPKLTLSPPAPQNKHAAAGKAPASAAGSSSMKLKGAVTGGWTQKLSKQQQEQQQVHSRRAARSVFHLGRH